MSATDAGLLERPRDPHELIGTNWYEIDHSALAAVAARIAKQAKAASTAEQKTHTDTNNYAEALPEGFEAQINAGHRVGRMAGELAGWFTPAATALGETAHAIQLAKLNTINTVKVAETFIWAAEFRIAQLAPVAAAGGIHGAQAQIEIDALRRQIEEIKDTARTAIAALYEGVPEPVLPAALGLTPVIHTGPPAGTGTGNGGAINVKPASTGSESGGGATPLDNSTRTEKRLPADERVDKRLPGETTTSPKESEPGRTSESESHGAETRPVAHSDSRLPGSLSEPASPASPAQPPVAVPPSVSAPSTGTGTPAGVPRVSSPAVSNPLGGLGSSPAGGALSGGGAPSAPSSAVPQTPAQQFLSGAAQGFSSQSPLATGASAAAAAQPFKPPPGSTMPAGPPPASPPASSAVSSSPGQAAQVQTPVSASPASASPAAGAPPANAVPLAPPPAAGVPPPTAAPPPPVAPAAPAPPAAPPPPPPPVLGLGKLSAAMKSANHVAHGEGLGAPPEFQAALALVAALHDPTLGVLSEWACAVFKMPGESAARFVLASREGLSWTPAGVYMPGGVTLAVHDGDAVPWEVRKLWRGLRPPAHVLAHYAKAIGETPRIVVARQWTGLAALFGRDTVIAADDHPTIMDPNPLRNPAGRHRLAVVAPHAWAWVQAVPDGEVLGRMRAVAAHVAAVHDQTYSPIDIIGADGPIPGDPALRGNAVGQIGRDGGAAVWSAVEQQMTYVRMQIMTAPLAIPNPLVDGWNDDLTDAEKLLRGWEVLWLAQRPATRENLADMTYAALAALDGDAVGPIWQIITEGVR